ncbi:hypothetical protein CEXT_569891 [Caerostris extrusa]|uniref:Uncharacterized protein n=1 Tax=Caerostris extrusa TaxID=172846 RepID=A0AAV4VTZ8_CAEEX|nr:hypothetical protein CEXT_569891 [Caerostris extrusa]
MYMCGGFDGDEIQSTAEVYDPDMDQWTLIGDMLGPRSGHVLISYQQSLLVIGGYDGETRLRTVECYDEEKKTFVEHVPLNHVRSNFAAAVVEDQLHVIGGYNDKFHITIQRITLSETSMTNSKSQFLLIITIKCYQKQTNLKLLGKKVCDSYNLDFLGPQRKSELEHITKKGTIEATRRPRSIPSPQSHTNFKFDNNYILFASACIPLVVVVMFCLWKSRKNGQKSSNKSNKYNVMDEDNLVDFEHLNKGKENRIKSPKFSVESSISASHLLISQDKSSSSVHGEYYHFTDCNSINPATKPSCHDDCLSHLPSLNLLIYNGYTRDMTPTSTDEETSEDGTLSSKIPDFDDEEHRLKSITDVTRGSPSCCASLNEKEVEMRYKGVMNTADMESSTSTSSDDTFSVPSSDYINQSHIKKMYRILPINV